MSSSSFRSAPASRGPKIRFMPRRDASVGRDGRRGDIRDWEVRNCAIRGLRTLRCRCGVSPDVLARPAPGVVCVRRTRPLATIATFRPGHES